MERINPEGLDLKDQVISINRVTKVVKGGKNLSFAALVVIGDNNGVVGFGTGKAKEDRPTAPRPPGPPARPHRGGTVSHGEGNQNDQNSVFSEHDRDAREAQGHRQEPRLHEAQPDRRASGQ